MPRQKKAHRSANKPVNLRREGDIELTLVGSRVTLSFEVLGPGAKLELSRRTQGGVETVNFTPQLDWAFQRIVKTTEPLPIFREGSLQDDLAPVIVRHLGRRDLHSFMMCNRWAMRLVVTLRGAEISITGCGSLNIMVAAGCPLDGIKLNYKDPGMRKLGYILCSRRGLWREALEMYQEIFVDEWIPPPREFILEANSIPTNKDAFRKLVDHFTSVLDRDVVQLIILHKPTCYNDGPVADYSLLLDCPYMPYKGRIDNRSLLMRPSVLEWFRQNPAHLADFIDEDSPAVYIQLYVDTPAAHKMLYISGGIHQIAGLGYESEDVLEIIYQTKWLFHDYIAHHGPRIRQFMKYFRTRGELN